MKPIKTPTFILPQLLRYGMLAFLIVTGASYGVWQARYLIAGPNIEINSPPAIVQQDRTVTLSGHAMNATKLFLNGRPIVTDQSGAFLESVVLENGVSAVSLSAYDRYGRETRWEQPMVYVEGNTMAERDNKEDGRKGL